MATVTTKEQVYEDGNRATTVKVDGKDVVIVTQGDGETDAQYEAAIAEAIASAEAQGETYEHERT